MRRLAPLLVPSLLLTLALPQTCSAAVGPYLRSLYQQRTDLQALFDPTTLLARPTVQTAVIGLEDWARQYGWRENAKLLFYKPSGVVPVATQTDPAPEVGVKGYVVIDRVSGLILAEHEAGVQRPIASLTKLMTAGLVLEQGVSLSKLQAITSNDMVGGSSLGVKAGTTFSVSDLFYAALLPSANDAANALAASTGLSRTSFVAEMNKRVQTLSLPRTSFADPTGIDEKNVSTPREFAALAETIFSLPSIRRVSQTGTRTITAKPSNTPITVKNSDDLLTKPDYDHLYVTAGKTGYLGPEVGWNLSVAMKPMKGPSHELIIVLLGGNTLKQTMADADRLGQWAWEHYTWK